MSKAARTKASVHRAIVEEARNRVAGHYSGYLRNGSFYDIEVTVDDFTMDMTLELEGTGLVPRPSRRPDPKLIGRLEDT